MDQNPLPFPFEYVGPNPECTRMLLYLTPIDSEDEGSMYLHNLDNTAHLHCTTQEQDQHQEMLSRVCQYQVSSLNFVS
jgi:hypothetical protein